MTKAELKARYQAIYRTSHNYLALSGGGGDGAFGAGLLVGWTAKGDRPEFSLVTGVSTGALIAPFAFLGPDYDAKLKEVYTTSSTEDIIKKLPFFKIRSAAAVHSPEPLRKMLAKYVDQETMEAIAAEYRKGRRLMIGTTNLDAGRPFTICLWLRPPFLVLSHRCSSRWKSKVLDTTRCTWTAARPPRFSSSRPGWTLARSWKNSK
ncbi:MAG: patatin-like phospholipase family protein [Deltaproteobacteria bacterium]|nr:patatin-like phospholipase family protein [Deltaproteobacteria bacterium]